jgi:hypothetical protein
MERAYVLRPGDLYINYHLWREALARNDIQKARVYSETLAYFPIEAIYPHMEELLQYATQVILDLVATGLWSREEASNVISFLVWQHNQDSSIEHLLQILLQGESQYADWHLYLKELYDRRSYFGRILSSASPIVSSNSWDSELRDEGALLSKALGIQQSVILGQNLVVNSNFAQRTLNGRITGWDWAAWVNNGQWNSALYVGGPDTFVLPGTHSIRIQGFWEAKDGKEQSRAGFTGFWNNRLLVDNGMYLLSRIFDVL